MRPNIPRQTALVLGGGGVKGFAHVGVLRALEERGVKPALLAGTSIGSLIAAAYAGGMSISEMHERCRSLRRRDLFRLNHMGMLMERLRAPSLYLEAPLREVCDAVVPKGTFDDLRIPLLINTVDIERGTQLVWGLPGMRDVQVADAAYASCALPGFFPPGQVDGRTCVDGGTIDNLPVSVAAVGMDALIAVDVGNSDLSPATDVTSQGLAAIYMRAATVMMHALQQMPLESWKGPPMLLIRPRVSRHGWFNFTSSEEIIEAGYVAAQAALDAVGDSLRAPGGVYPRRMVRVSVDREKCIGCTTCVALAPRYMTMDSSGKAIARAPMVEWSPAEGDFVNHCPTLAISERTVGEGEGDGEPKDVVGPSASPEMAAD